MAFQAEKPAALSEAYQRAMAAAEKAVALDSELPDGYAVRGRLRTFKGDWEGARADAEKALALNPGAAALHLSYARFVLLPLGRIPDAIRESQKATDLDPLSAGAWSTLGELYWMNGELGSAQAALERSLRIFPEQNDYASVPLGLTLLYLKKPSEAFARAEQIAVPQLRLYIKALALHDLGRTEEARHLLEQMIASHAGSAPCPIALVYAWFGETDRAFEWLQRCHEREGAAGAGFLRAAPILRSLHGDPRFAALLKKMNLPAD